MRRALHVLALAGALVLGGCSTDSAPGYDAVTFRASDGVRLTGQIYGDGDVGVILAHMGRPGDSLLDWQDLAGRLADDGYVVLAYNRRGICTPETDECSSGIDAYELSWRDLVGASDFLRSRGVRRTVVVGASIGAMAALYAASQRRIDPVALVEFGGINNASGYSFTPADIRRIRGAKLFLSSRGDVYGAAAAAREWYRWARPPKRLEVLPGADHGTDLLRREHPQKAQVTELIAEFVASAAPAD